MDKINEITEFNEQYKTYNDTKKDVLSKIINRLLNESYLIKVKKEDEEDFYKALELIDDMNKYLSIIDYEVNYDRNIGIIYIENMANKNRLHINKFETVILLLLRIRYYKESKKASLSNIISVSFSDLKMDVKKTNIYKEEKSVTEFIEALKDLKKYKLIEYYKVKDFSLETQIFVYPSILHVVNIDSIDELNNTLTKYLGENKNEEINED